MKGIESLTKFMRLGCVYRREELEGVSKSLSRDLKGLIESRKLLRVGPGIYCRPRKNVIGLTPPKHRDVIRVFLRTDDFLITSYNWFTNLGLGLTQMYNCDLVYNHKRGGYFVLGNLRYHFRVIRAYPKKLSIEYLVVDLLNHVRKLPDDTGRAVKNLPSNMNRFNRKKLSTCLERYGNFHAKRILGPMLRSNGSAGKPEGE
ncbi:MAG: hypothetical protein HY921_04255 [Elusimicrobia bacterium]|nr:hypothetical protein [Elusimicrobiota bacterium]